ncbi:MAG TPA: hypothetical protein VF054_12585, partial [Micromonosporaceae bacterium]
MRTIAPRVDTPPRPVVDDVDRDRVLYLRSFLLMRMVIGLLGVAVPVMLVLGDRLLFGGEPLRGSLSAYYHTGMHDVFVGSLSTIGFFLITYMLFHYNWDNVLSIVAGLAIIGVALFPTGGNSPLTPLQVRIGEHTVSTVHQVCAVIFILSLAIISFLFGHREGQRPDRTPEQRRRGKLLHWACAFAIIAAVVYVLVTKWLGQYDRYSMFFGETIATFAFGLSWLMKGFELEILVHGRLPQP